MALDKAYWENRYTSEQIGWNIGYPSTPIQTYIDQLEDKTLKILIPGAGNSYEAEYLWNLGFENIFVLDFARQPLENLKYRISTFPESQLLNIDFFELNDSFDLILEQTFFCALSPNLRKSYVDKMHQLLNPKGRHGQKDVFLIKFIDYFNNKNNNDETVIKKYNQLIKIYKNTKCFTIQVKLAFFSIKLTNEVTRNTSTIFRFF